MIWAMAFVLSLAMLVAAQWQWSRYKYKVQLLESFRANSLTTPLPFPPVRPEQRQLGEHSQLRDKKLVLSGVFDYSRQVIIANRSGQIGASAGPGYYLLAPFRLNSGSGPALMVNRGFIPFADREPESWKQYDFGSGEQQLTGVLADAILPGLLNPKNPEPLVAGAMESATPIGADVSSATTGPGNSPLAVAPMQRIWFFEEIPAIAKQLPYPVLDDVFLQQLGGPPHGEFPREAVRIQVPPSTHFGYTIEWILLACATWGVAFFLQCFRRRPVRHLRSAPVTNSSFVPSALLLLGLLLVLAPSSATAIEKPEALESEVGIIQHLGASIDLSLPFRGTDGSEHQLREFALPGKPFLIVPVYYGCPRLCTLTFEAMAKLLREMRLQFGAEFSVIAFSIDPEDTPDIAEKKARSVYEKIPGKNADPRSFPFLVGPASSIKPLTNQLGFVYRQDGMDFAHSPGMMVVTPEGRIARYFLGVDYSESDVRHSLVEAADGKIGGLAEQIFLYCFRFDQTKGKYTPAAWRLMRIVSILVASALILLLVRLWRNEGSKGVDSGSGGFAPSSDDAVPIAGNVSTLMPDPTVLADSNVPKDQNFPKDGGAA